MSIYASSSAPWLSCHIVPSVPNNGTVGNLARGGDYAPFMSYNGALNSSTITQNFGRQGDTATIVLVDDYYADMGPAFPNTPGEPHFIIPPFSTISVVDNYAYSEAASRTSTGSPSYMGALAGGNLFTGIVPNPKWQWISPGRVEWVLECVDFTYYADSSAAQGVYVGQHAHAIMADITKQANCGIVAVTSANGGSVYPGPVIHLLNLSWDKVSNHWDTISKQASQSVVYGWFVDNSLRLWFYPSTMDFPSGVTVTDKVSYSTPNLYECHVDPSQQMYYEYDAATFYTRAFVNGATITHTYKVPEVKKKTRKHKVIKEWMVFPSRPTDTWTGDGRTRSWNLTHTPDVTDSSINLSTRTQKQEESDYYLLVGGVAQRVEVYDGQSTVGAPFMLVQTYPDENWHLEVVSGKGATPAEGVKIEFWYKWTASIHAAKNATRQINRFSHLPNRGRFITVVNDQTITNAKTAVARASSTLSEYSKVQERFTFYTSESWGGVMRVGQTFEADMTQLMDSQRYYQLGLKARFFVIQQQITFKNNGRRSSQITAIRQ